MGKVEHESLPSPMVTQQGHRGEDLNLCFQFRVRWIASEQFVSMEDHRFIRLLSGDVKRGTMTEERE